METTTSTTKKIKIVMLSMALTVGLLAQEQIVKKKAGKLDGGFGYSNLTCQSINIGGLNNLLTGNGYHKLNSNQLSFGGGGNFVIKNFLIGGEGSGFIGSRVSSNANSIDLTGGYGYFNFGYVIYSNKRSVLYPMLGIGGGGYSFIVQQNNASNNFNDQINSPNGGVVIDASGMLLNGQLAYQYFLGKKGRDGGFFIGLKAGYHYSPSSWKMAVGGNAISNGPNINMNGFYASLFIGGGSL